MALYGEGVESEKKFFFQKEEGSPGLSGYLRGIDLEISSWDLSNARRVRQVKVVEAEEQGMIQVCRVR